MPGELAILNVADGDTKLVFDGKDPDEAARGALIITEMIRKGFAILIEVGRDDKGPIYRRAQGFDPETLEYIVAGVPSDATPATESTADEETEAQEIPDLPPQRKATRSAGRSSKAKPTRVAASSTNAVAVARTAGG